MPADIRVYTKSSSKRGMLHCPNPLDPTATAKPSLRRSTVWWKPAEIWVYVIPSAKGGMLHCPPRLAPMATALPSLRRRTVWPMPAEIWVYLIPSSKRGMLHCPKWLFPMATALPSLRRSTVWAKPAEICAYAIPTSKIGDVALSILIVSDGNSITITTEKYCVTGACRNLVVCKSGIQRRDVAPPLSAGGSNGNSTAIAAEKNCMTNARRNLGVLCETLLVNYPQMSSARGRALSEQRRHPIHRAKKPWTKTKRPASNQPQNKRGETQAIANDINSKWCRDQHSTLRAMPKFPNGSLHKNKPSMNTIHVSIHTRNDPPKPSHKNHKSGCIWYPHPNVGWETAIRCFSAVMAVLLPLETTTLDSGC